MRKPQFYIPRIDMWNWQLVSTVFVSFQLTRAQEAYRETDGALEELDREIGILSKEVRSVWQSASATTMRSYEARYREVQQERKRIGFVRYKLRGVIDRMTAHLEEEHGTAYRA